MTDSIKIYNSIAEFYLSMGGILEQDVDFTIHRLEEIHSDVPFKSPILYSVQIIIPFSRFF
ncbi:MAG: hypothetical protein KME64_18405 [Scytonematopsis contorta HA4267-MV1]|jgi:hypothetical protein|nr:hypothetical protein [Scytonematopsis contorta HA4267-MV1]